MHTVLAMEPHAPHASARGPEEELVVRIDAAGAHLDGELVVPVRPLGLVLFAHANGSSRLSPRDQYVARALRRDAGVATLLVDLLGEAEDALDARTAELRFDVPLLARRLYAIADFTAHDRRTLGLPLGLFGASTGAAAALVTAAKRPGHVEAVVARAGRPDLADAAVLANVRAPTLLVVGSDDPQLVELNRQALRAVPAESRLEVVRGATRHFEEPGALDEVARLATRWFDDHLGAGAA